jgi:hypothetical protein
VIESWLLRLKDKSNLCHGCWEATNVYVEVHEDTIEGISSTLKVLPFLPEILVFCFIIEKETINIIF